MVENVVTCFFGDTVYNPGRCLRPADKLLLTVRRTSPLLPENSSCVI